MKRTSVSAAILLSLLLLGACASLAEQRRIANIDHYVRVEGDVPRSIEAAMRAGVVVPGMTRDQALLTLGRGWGGHSPLWSVELHRGRVVSGYVPLGRPYPLKDVEKAWLATTRTQFASNEPVQFLVRFDGDRVSEIRREFERIDRNEVPRAEAPAGHRRDGEREPRVSTLGRE